MTTIRPNVRRITSSHTLVRTHIVNMAGLVILAGMAWAFFFMWIVR